MTEGSGTADGNRLDQMLAEARAGLRRVAAAQLDADVARGALVVDVRPEELRRRYGGISGAMVIGLNILEWRLAPDSVDRVIDIEPDRVVILVCQQGYSSSLAAHRLQRLGLTNATDLIGGFEALAELRERDVAGGPSPRTRPSLRR